MTKATEQDLSELHGAIARGLTEAVKATKTEEGVIHAPAAYFMAGIAMLKNNNITADAGTNADLQALNKALADKRKTSKGRLLSPDSAQAAIDALERDLGGMME